MDTGAIVESVQALPITQALRDAKASGDTPIAKVLVADGEVKRVVLRIGTVRYYFHATQDSEGHPIEVGCSAKDIAEWEWLVPYDGWEASAE